MAVWAIKIPLADVFHNEDLTFEARRDAIVERFKNTLGPKRHPALHDLLEEISYAEDADEFDDLWDDIYDYCDDERIWVGTF